MPLPNSRSGEERNLITAIAWINKGYTQKQVIQSLLEARRGITPEQAEIIAFNAQQHADLTNRTNERMFGTTGEGELPENAVWEDAFELTIDVFIPQRDGTVKVRSLRRSVKPGMTDLDVMADIQDAIDEIFSGASGDDAGNITFRIRTIT